MKKITNAWICQIVDKSVIPIFGDLIYDEKIIEIIPSGNVASKYQGSKVYDAGGRVLTIPNVNFHDHIYSRLAKGLAITGSMDSFVNILKSLWWKLDMLLDLDMVKASAEYAAIESIKNGVTYIFDHHSSPKNIMGSLSTIADVFKEFNLRGNLCFEISDRNGTEICENSILESEQILARTNLELQTILGLHASFTLSDETLSKVSKIIKKNDLGIHIHSCEGKVDRAESLYKYEAAPVHRLEKFGLLNSKSILAHGNYLTQEDYQIINKYGSALVYNPESNMNNSVGFANYLSVPNKIPILCGTDGMHANVSKSLKQLLLLVREQGNSFEDSFVWINKIYFDQLNFVRKYFPDFTNLQKGDRADFIIWDYIPPTPFSEDNFFGHYVYDILESSVKTVTQNGEFLMKDFELENIDEVKLNKKINIQGCRLTEMFNRSVSS